MRKILFLFATIIMLPVFASAQMPKTVTDYFLAFPNDKYAVDFDGKKITNKAALTKFRKSLIKIEDTKNGYLRLEGAWEGWAEIVLFKKKDGDYLIAHAESGCGPACDGFVKFYTYKAGNWTEVTETVFPKLTETEIKKAFNDKKIDSEENGLSHYFLLPRVGKTVKMACNMCEVSGSDASNENETILMQFEWNGTKFLRK